MLARDTTPAEARLLAERLRSTIETLAYGGNGGDTVVKVTASIGVATYEGDAFKRSEQLIKAARKGVTAAKDDGSNRVRVFVPKAETRPEAA